MGWIGWRLGKRSHAGFRGDTDELCSGADSSESGPKPGGYDCRIRSQVSGTLLASELQGQIARGFWAQSLGFSSYLLCELGSGFAYFCWFVCLLVCIESGSYVAQISLKLTM